MLGAPLEVEKFKSTRGTKHIWKIEIGKTQRVWSIFGSWDVEKKAWRFCAKHISKSKCLRSGARLEVEMLKKCTPLWREARFEASMYKTLPKKRLQLQSTFGSWDVEKAHASVARSTFPGQTGKTCSDRVCMFSPSRGFASSQLTKVWGTTRLP